LGKSTGLKPRLTKEAHIKYIEQKVWRLEIPDGTDTAYRLAQLDDYNSLNRDTFPWKPPFTLNIRARASSQTIPGTWGFGLWNDPFSFSLGFGGGTRRVPALPNAAWFFFASPQNALSLRDDLPGAGNLAATFRTRRIPAPITMVGALTLPLFLIPPIARLLRRFGTRYVHQDAKHIKLEVTAWHSYHILWEEDQVVFYIDSEPQFTTSISPLGPLGLVIWVDNQFLSLHPGDRLRYGTLPNPDPSWIEIQDVYANGKELSIDKKSKSL
jgi:hypothetical protein